MMKNSVEHLPEARQDDLTKIVKILRDEFEQVVGFSNGKKKSSRILKIILFGSYATGKWVKNKHNINEVNIADENGWVRNPVYHYESDFDILVILNRRELVEDHRLWNAAEDRVNISVEVPLNLLIHTLKEVNDNLAEGQYFFTDIKREGIVLYESDSTELAQPKELTPAEYKVIAEHNFDYWFNSAKGFYRFFQVGLEEGNFKGAVFQLHQAAERLYSCALLVYTNYKPNTHNLVQLNAFALQQEEEFASAFPQNSKFARRHFQLLKRAYVESRYSKHYRITASELIWLSERVLILMQLTERLCQEKIDSLI
jgi:predicted nucleotidyltransferase/HEPN domain-containing protein